MNELKNYPCLSKARYRGLDNVQIQAYMAAIAINIKRLVNLLLSSILHYYDQKQNIFYNRPVPYLSQAGYKIRKKKEHHGFTG
jgi:hypothetical protein